jgi:acid phosphatase
VTGVKYLASFFGPLSFALGALAGCEGPSAVERVEQGEHAPSTPGLAGPSRIPCPARHRTTYGEENSSADNSAALQRIQRFIIIVMENHSFDSLYGQFPGADGLLNAECEFSAPPQVDPYGETYVQLPKPPSVGDKVTPFDALPNEPFPIAPLVPPSANIIDLVHRFYTEQAQINAGAMNKFAALSDAGSVTMGFYDTMKLPVPPIALDYTVCDRFFHSAFGGSFLNHMWLIGARSPFFPNPPSSWVESGTVEVTTPFPMVANVFTGEDNVVTPDGYAVNLLHSVNTPHGDGALETLLPSQTYPTIGDRLSAAGVSWAWYSGGWNATLQYYATRDTMPDAGVPAEVSTFQYHHQPFVYFANFADGTAAKREHLKDETDFLEQLRQGTLPAVSFLKPGGLDNEHPGYAPLLIGEEHLADLIRRIMAAPGWADTAIIVTYDENGGFADHVAPPVIDRWGPGTRIPTLIISEHAKKHYVDHTQYETVSILTTLERRFGLEPLTSRDANARDLSNAFE